MYFFIIQKFHNNSFYFKYNYAHTMFIIKYTHTNSGGFFYRPLTNILDIIKYIEEPLLYTSENNKNGQTANSTTRNKGFLRNCGWNAEKAGLVFSYGIPWKRYEISFHIMINCTFIYNIIGGPNYISALNLKSATAYNMHPTPCTIIVLFNNVAEQMHLSKYSKYYKV